MIVVASPMGDTTGGLVAIAACINRRPPQRELDILLTAGECI